MGQKTHPIGFRLGITKGWFSNWYAGRYMTPFIILDELFRQYLEKNYPKAKISRVHIHRTITRDVIQTRVIIYAARPRELIGGKEALTIRRIENDLNRIVRRFNKDYRQVLIGKQIEQGRLVEIRPVDSTGVPLLPPVHSSSQGEVRIIHHKLAIEVMEVVQPELDAVIVAKTIAEQLEARLSHRRVMKAAVAQAMRAGAEGIKIRCTGRLGGAEMSRSEEYREGHIALQTLRSDIDYATATAHTIYGAIGVKVWILKGTLYGKVDLFPHTKESGRMVAEGRKGERAKSKKK
ncbi:MAG: 30S ribosomal protein S3 [Bacteroidia bacterium]|nr:30S ribosomal protein S3 [Bacteroidia bacterium]MDW8089659.1 30S ribosomal protein S3 [Bacteroidia bacterium]